MLHDERGVTAALSRPASLGYGMACSPVIFRMGTAPPHHVHRSPSTRLPTEASGCRSMSAGRGCARGTGRWPRDGVLHAVSALFAPDSRNSIVQGDSLWSGRMLSPTKKKTKMFHASMKVTRLEEWCAEAETPDQARALLESGAGHRLCIGECLDVELEQLLED
jgi:hypothetical protein